MVWLSQSWRHQMTPQGSGDQVKFGEDGGSMEGGGEILDVRDRVAIRDSYAVVTAWSPISRGLLWNHVKGR